MIACFDPLGNAVHTHLSYDLIGEDVLITGAGPSAVCQWQLPNMWARVMWSLPMSILSSGISKKNGSNRAVDVRAEKITPVMKELGMKEGFDVGLEMSGNTNALESMLEHMFHGGNIALLGLLGQGAIDWDYVIFNSLTLKGIYGRRMFETWYKMTTMLQSGLDILPIITHRFDYTEFEQGFELMRSGNSVR